MFKWGNQHIEDTGVYLAGNVQNYSSEVITAVTNAQTVETNWMNFILLVIFAVVIYLFYVLVKRAKR